jgi:hypothetical protein
MSMNVATSSSAGLVATDRRGPRRRVRLAATAIGMVLAAGLAFRIAAEKDRAPTTLNLPPSVPPVIALRLQALHARYDAIAVDSGVPAMRARILSDINGFRGHDEWLDAIAQWIARVGWHEAADFCVDIAEIGGSNVKRSCVSMLASMHTPLVVPTNHGPRIRKLSANETDPATLDYIGQIRRRLGV